MSTDRWNTLRDGHVYHRQVDPFIEDYLDSLTPAPSSGLLDTWLTDLWDFDAPDELVRWVGRYLFLGPIQRAYEPGCLIREAPVLIGPPGVGKSSVARAIVPPQFEFVGFTDGLNLASSPKVLLEATQGRIVVEASEMIGATRRSELEAIKSFMVRRDDGHTRLSYRHDPEPALRRFVIVGTSNGASLPPDAAAQARFVAVEISPGMGSRAKVRPETHVGRIRDNLFAEALFLYRQGERCNLPAGFHGLRDANNLRHVARDLILDDVLDDPEVLPHCGRLRMKDLAPKLARKSRHRVSPQVLAETISTRGWQMAHTKTGNVWQKTCPEPEACPMGEG